MKQAIIRRGRVIAEDVPAPQLEDGCVLIKTAFSCISTGTEVSSVEGTSGNILQKILKHPKKVLETASLIKNQGFKKTKALVDQKLQFGFSFGYSASGTVEAVGRGVSGIKIGDYVAAAGFGYARHASLLSVPQNLVMKIPSPVSFKEASTVALGGIALQGVRRADLKIGEYATVIGTGVLGLLTIQMLKASGVRVFATDFDDRRLELAKQFGAEITMNSGSSDLMKDILNWTHGQGVDGVLFTAATKNSSAISNAFKMCRRKGQVTLVGVSGLELNRDDLYLKELDFKVSTSYGPGRYDKSYEEKGVDYPYAYVRWTENRNMEAYLMLLAQKAIDLSEIIEKTFPISRVEAAFQFLQNETPKPLVCLLEYENLPQEESKVPLSSTILPKCDKKIIQVGLIGTGGFATGQHLPIIKGLKDQYVLKAVMNRTGSKAKDVGKLYKASYCTSNADDIFHDPDITLAVIATRHDSHAELTLKALEAGKNVFVEKPLATTQEELKKIQAFYQTGDIRSKPLLFVGFNRRFSPCAVEVQKHTSKRISPLFIYYRMNAGYIPLDHWVHENGGRIVGEACHIIDLFSFLTGSPVIEMTVSNLSPKTKVYSETDNKVLTLKYEDGSIATLHYASTGAKDFPKEYMEINFDGKTIQMEDYKTLKGYNISIKHPAAKVPQKGLEEEWEALHKALRGEKSWPISLESLLETTHLSIEGSK